MRVFAIAALALLGACAGPQCHLTETHDISFSSLETRDTVTASTEGANCAEATATLTVHNAAGAELYRTSVPVGDVVVSITERPADRDVSAFLAQWANQSVSYTALAPQWSTLTRDANVSQDRNEYAAIRASQARMICPRTTANRVSCVYWDETAGRAVHLYDRGLDRE